MGILSAVLLYVLAANFSDTDVETNRYRILGLSVGVGVVDAVLGRLIGSSVVWVAIWAADFLLIAAGLQYWCGTSRNQALKVAGMFLGIRVILAIALIFISSRI